MRKILRMPKRYLLTKILFNKVLRACKLNQAHNQGGGKPGICIHPEVFRHHFRFYKKGDVDLWF